MTTEEKNGRKNELGIITTIIGKMIHVIVTFGHMYVFKYYGNEVQDFYNKFKSLCLETTNKIDEIKKGLDYQNLDDPNENELYQKVRQSIKVM